MTRSNIHLNLKSEIQMDSFLIKKESDSFSYYTIANTIDYVNIYDKFDGLLRRANVYGYYASVIIIWIIVKFMCLQLLFYNLLYTILGFIMILFMFKLMNNFINDCLYILLGRYNYIWRYCIYIGLLLLQYINTKRNRVKYYDTVFNMNKLAMENNGTKYIPMDKKYIPMGLYKFIFIKAFKKCWCNSVYIYIYFDIQYKQNGESSIVSIIFILRYL
eukprot:208491_1